MTDILRVQLSLREVSQAIQVSDKTIIDIVEHGIVEPAGSAPENWRFNNQMMMLTQKALRLRRDLDIEWPGIALALSLLEQLEQLREDNKQLRRRLDRFLAD